MRTDYAGHDAVYRERRAAGIDGWDPPEVTADVLRQYGELLSHSSVPRSGPLLEVGCGAGNHTVEFARRGYRVTGLDISPTAIAWARERARRDRLEVEFVAADFLTWNGTDVPFSIVVDGHCLHCISGEDRRTFLRRAHQLLEYEGVLVVNTMCRNENTVELHGFDPETGIIERGGIATRTIGHRSEIEKEVESAGFEILDGRVESTDHRTGDLLLVARKTAPSLGD